jgi:hypothetical protein
MPCPAIECTGNGPIKPVTDPQSVKMPLNTWEANKGKDIWHHQYCGFIWSTFIDERFGRRRASIGHYDSQMIGTGKFVPNDNYPMKPEPKPKKSRRR